MNVTIYVKIESLTDKMDVYSYMVVVNNLYKESVKYGAVTKENSEIQVAKLSMSKKYNLNNDNVKFTIKYDSPERAIKAFKSKKLKDVKIKVIGRGEYSHLDELTETIDFYKKFREYKLGKDKNYDKWRYEIFNRNSW